ncbi:MAG: DUF1549 and DUF1553 domain-containing protein [Pirellulaceae bacterium]
MRILNMNNLNPDFCIALRRFQSFAVCCMLLGCTALIADETNPPAAGSAAPAVADAPTPSALTVLPAQIALTNLRDRQSIVAQLVWSHGITSDVSHEAKIEVVDPKIARCDGFTLFPLADGQTAVRVTHGTFVVEIPITVQNAQTDLPISFKNDVMPVFSKSGCNTGSCHGAARGKDGFRLSLYGFDVEGDYFRLTREMLGRRVNLAIPEECLLINKSTGEVSHTGGTLMTRDSERYQTLMRWLQAGAPNDSGPVPEVTAVEIFPKNGVLDGEGATQQISVRAKYADGTDRDVTSLSYFMSSNDNSAVIDQLGKISAKNRGEAFIMARFGTFTEGVPFIVLPKGLEFTWANAPENNYVDTLVNTKLKNLRINPSETCTDEVFLRRVFLDICGLTPSTDEVNAFMADTAADKRAKVIDQLLERKEFVEMWVMKWSELLQIRSSNQVSYKATLLYYNWLQQQISENVPVDEMIRKLLGSQGGTFSNAATNYYQNEQDTLKVAENVAQVFLGTRIQCAQCHNHPFDRWTMSDYYQFAAFFSQIGRKASTDPREQIVFNSGGGEVAHPVTKQAMPPKFLGGAQPDVAGKDRRVLLAEWLTAKDNKMFGENLANIVWSHFFGRGIVHEVDDVRVSNPPSNPELLAELGKKFGEYGFDFKRLVRDICNSRTYQLKTQTNPSNESDTTNFSHSTLRRIRAEVMLDVISKITETENKFRGLPVGARAVQIADGNTSNYFLTTFGRAQRETVCSCEVKMEPNLSQALHLINGDTVNAKIQQGNLVGKMLAAGKTPDEVLNEIYLRCLARQPNEQERQLLAQELATAGEPKAALEDVFWAVLNSREFVFNH